MQQTYQTNDNNNKEIRIKQYVAIANAKNKQKCQTQIQTIVKHVQQMQQTYQTNHKHIKK